MNALYSVNSNELDEQEQEVVRHYHYIAWRNYDRTIMKNKLNSFRNFDLQTQSIQGNQLEHNNNTSAKDKRVMLVEDEDDTAMLFRMILESDASLKVDSFTNPFLALDNFRSGLYDLIMIDIAMPKMNGFELYYKIRKLDDKVKVCFLTAGEMYYEDIRKEVFSEFNAHYFIRKPIANQDLIQYVKDILTEVR